MSKIFQAKAWIIPCLHKSNGVVDENKVSKIF